MHEFGVTESIIRGLLAQLEQQQITRVQTVRFRRSSAFCEDVLLQAFAVLSAGTPLAGANLMVEVTRLEVACARCGQTGLADSGTLVGHLYCCPACGATREVNEAHDLELVAVEVRDP